MSVQFIETDDGKRLAVLPEADYRALIEAKEEILRPSASSTPGSHAGRKS